MSVLIKDMQKPDRCIDCPFMISRDNDDCILQSDAANELFMNWEDMKLNCPLVEFPEHHGRLIDEDEIIVPSLSSWADQVIVADAIQDAHTVIEADRG